MIVAMKIISVGFDVDQGTLSEVPDVLEFTGYCVFTGNVIFGPWISFSSYLKAADGVDLVSTIRVLRHTRTVQGLFLGSLSQRSCIWFMEQLE